MSDKQGYFEEDVDEGIQMSLIQERKMQVQMYEASIAPPTEELKLSDIRRFVVRRRWWIVAFSVVGLVGGLFATIRAPRLYTATTTVELNKDASSGLGIQDLSGLASQVGVGQEFMTDMLTHQAVLLNDNTALSVINHLGLMQTHPYVDIPTGKMRPAFAREGGLPLEQAPLTRDRALEIFHGGLRVLVVKNTRLLTVSYTDTDPQRAGRIANAVVEAYLTNHTEARYTATSKASTWLTNQLEDLKRRVEESHKKVSAFEQSTGLIGITPSTKGGAPTEASTNTAYERLTALNAELSRAEVARIAKEAVYHLTETGDPDVVLGVGETSLATGMGGDSPITAGSKDIQLLQKLREQESSLKVRMASEQVRYGAKNPALQEIRNQIDSIEMQIHEELQRINKEAKTDLQLAKANEDAIRKSVNDQQRGVASLGNSLAALMFLQQEENTSRGLYQDLYTRLEEANIAAGVKSSDIVIVDPARPPGRPSSPVAKMNLAGGLFMGSLVGLLVAGVQHLRDTSLNSLEDFEAIWEFPLLGIVRRFGPGPRAKFRHGRPGVEIQKPLVQAKETAWLLTAPKSEIAESYRNIRTSILLSNIDRTPQVILFTSPLSGDGKSTTAYNLAIAFGVQSKRVLLLDADMRRPTIGQKTNCNNKKGLSDLLASDLSLDDVVQQHPGLPSLYVLTSGTIPPMPAELLASERFARLIEQMREQFDYILIDAPPVLLVSDPLLLAVSVDGIVLVVRAGVTTKPAMKRLRTALQKPNVKALGYVLNDLREDSEAYGYGYGYGDNDKSGYFENGSRVGENNGYHLA
jgi:capsular exopolysaccharide synthesis family protein